mgnify:CR=1 FL=1
MRSFNSQFTVFALIAATVTPLLLTSPAHAEEKSMWQKFKDFFSPVPTVEGEGPEYDELRALDQDINKLEGKYSRERRPNNKKRIKKDIDTLKAKRETLAKKIETKEKTEKKAQSSTESVSQSSSKPQPSSAPSNAAVCAHDTVFVHDTITVHDTLYVIVANQNAAPVQAPNQTPATAPDSSTASAQAPTSAPVENSSSSANSGNQASTDSSNK